MRFGVVVFPGSGGGADCRHVIEQVLREEAEYIWHRDTDVSACDCLVLPGGPSFGNHLRCGAIAGVSPVMGAVADFARRGGLVIGINNGFQVLLEAGLLPGAVLPNAGLSFICRFAHVRVENAATPWTGAARPGQVLRLPIAHGEGNYTADAETLARLRDEGRIVLRYCEEDGAVGDAANPDGSAEGIAAICGEGLNVFGLMPCPERASEEVLGSADGLVIWESVMAHYGSRG